MKKYITSIIIIIALAACNRHQDVPPYTLGKVIKSDTATTVRIHINSRLTATQLIAIAGKIKSDSSGLHNLKLVYLLPGNADTTTGPNSYYAAARYLGANNISAADTLKDSDGDVLRLHIYGISAVKAKQLLGVTNAELTGKKILGKFIDDYNHTVIIPFHDPALHDELRIIELDSVGKMVSGTVPLIGHDKTGEKWQVTQQGDYMKLKDSVLSQYSIDDFGVPFNSIKAGN